MKYGSLTPIETKTSGFTSYADIGLTDNKMSYTEKDMKEIREQLEKVQQDLKVQTKRCRHLVAEYTRKLLEKESLYRSEKTLRDNQLAKVLKALLIFEARLKQEQKLISHQLGEKDYIIKTQDNHIKKLLSNSYCKNCNQYYAKNVDTFDSSSEYVGTDYQSSNFESLESSSETCGDKSESYEKIKVQNSSKNRYNLQGRRKKSIGTYFEVLKLRNESPMSNEDNTSADYDHLDSLPPESITDKISLVSENIENMLNKPNGSSESNNSSSECDKTVITAIESKETNIEQTKEAENKLTDDLPVFETNGEVNDNWYASASDQEDEEQNNVYRNNPVLECMNQILLQNISDINSPPKTPNIQRKNNKNNKRVKFSDEEEKDYYETPIQKTPNYYETPQSIYSNDYEQIMSKSTCSSEGGKTSTSSSLYIEMERNEKIEPRQNKILRTPPALPPKPPNLVAKSKIQNAVAKKPPSEASCDLEPDYCSISELNLPQNMNKINVVADVHPPPVEDKNRLNSPTEKVGKKTFDESLPKDDIPNMVVKKCVEKLNIQLAKQTAVKEPINSPRKKNEVQIPKLPQVSEIIIPDDPEEVEEPVAASQDNYIKNTTQILREKSGHDPRRPIVIGTSVSSLISGFNNQMINEIKKKHDKLKPKKSFSNFDNQNVDKRPVNLSEPIPPTFENFDLSQNFEEFKLDDCEIEEYDVEEELEREEKSRIYDKDNKDDRPELSSKRSTMDYLKIDLPARVPNVVKGSHEGTKLMSRPTYEHFLECTGLSSKSILTSSRNVTSHKHMLKPKDIKLRSKLRASANIFEKLGDSRLKFLHEPFV